MEEFHPGCVTHRPIHGPHPRVARKPWTRSIRNRQGHKRRLWRERASYYMKIKHSVNILTPGAPPSCQAGKRMLPIFHPKVLQPLVLSPPLHSSTL